MAALALRPCTIQITAGVRVVRPVGTISFHLVKALLRAFSALAS